MFLIGPVKVPLATYVGGMDTTQEANNREGVELIALRLYEFFEWIELLFFDATGDGFVSAVLEETVFTSARLADVDPIAWAYFLDRYKREVHGEEPLSPTRRVECAPMRSPTPIAKHAGGDRCGWNA